MVRGEVPAGDPRPCITVLESLPGAPFAATLRRAQHPQARAVGNGFRERETGEALTRLIKLSET